MSPIIRYTPLNASPQGGREYLLCDTISIAAIDLLTVADAQLQLIDMKGQLIEGECGGQNEEELRLRIAECNEVPTLARERERFSLRQATPLATRLS